MFTKITLALTGLLVFAVTPVLAANCNTTDVSGSYTRLDQNFDVIGDGSVFHNLIFQLTLNKDGTASQYWTGIPDYLIGAGTSSPFIGSWSCRSDGNVVVSFIWANYSPIKRKGISDVALVEHRRATYLFSVDTNSLTRVQGRVRVYLPSEDPTNPNGGTLGPIFTNTATYTRLTASDADLLLP